MLQVYLKGRVVSTVKTEKLRKTCTEKKSVDMDSGLCICLFLFPHGNKQTDRQCFFALSAVFFSREFSLLPPLLVNLLNLHRNHNPLLGRLEVKQFIELVRVLRVKVCDTVHKVGDVERDVADIGREPIKLL